jgi:hypothetical protein
MPREGVTGRRWAWLGVKTFRRPGFQASTASRTSGARSVEWERFVHRAIRFGRSSFRLPPVPFHDRQSLWFWSLRVMETPWVKTLGTTPGQDSGACWPKADYNAA